VQCGGAGLAVDVDRSEREQIAETGEARTGELRELVEGLCVRAEVHDGHAVAVRAEERVVGEHLRARPLDVAGQFADRGLDLGERPIPDLGRVDVDEQSRHLTSPAGRAGCSG
jgi:hypothetical protein